MWRRHSSAVILTDACQGKSSLCECQDERYLESNALACALWEIFLWEAGTAICDITHAIPSKCIYCAGSFYQYTFESFSSIIVNPFCAKLWVSRYSLLYSCLVDSLLWMLGEKFHSDILPFHSVHSSISVSFVPSTSAHVNLGHEDKQSVYWFRHSCNYSLVRFYWLVLGDCGHY